MSPPVNNNHIPPRVTGLVKPNGTVPKKAPSKGHLGSRSVVPPAMRFAASMKMNTANLANLRSAPGSGANYQDSNLMKLVGMRLDNADSILKGGSSGLNFSSSGGVSSGSAVDDKMSAVLGILLWIENAVALSNVLQADQAGKDKALQQAELMKKEATSIVASGAAQFCVSAASSAASCAGAISSATGDAAKAGAEAAQKASNIASKVGESAEKVAQLAEKATKATEEATKAASRVELVAKRVTATTKVFDTLGGAVKTGSDAVAANNRASQAILGADKESLKITADSARKILDDITKLFAAIREARKDFEKSKVDMMRAISRA